MKITQSVYKKSPKSFEIYGLGCFEDEKIADAALRKAAKDKKFKGGSSDTLLVTDASKKSVRYMYLLGLGKRNSFTLEKARRAAARLTCQAKGLRLRDAKLDLDSLSEKFGVEEVAGAAVEGARLSAYRFQKYKSKPSPQSSFGELQLVYRSESKSAAVKKAVAEAEFLSQAVIFTRDVANEPANVMTPPRLAQAAREMASKNNLICRVLGKSEIQRLKMGGILGVAQGSSFPPQLVILENKVKNATAKSPIVLVGKGVCFDTGGISIKPSGDMDKMKFDMCGAAAVMGALKAVANLKLPVKVIGITPLVENMPGSKAQRPGDIIRCMNGKTVEVLNTDAEGRLILADALVYAKKFNPKLIRAVCTGFSSFSPSELPI